MLVKKWLWKARLRKVINMTILAKPMMGSLIIKSSKREQFIRESNNNVISKDFLKQCRESSKLIKRK
ncbi:hypothetical protein ACRTAL_002235 [Clostridium perfringens]|uniref:hypothetical protein n=1 Tax=Clostridium perfringens TaxID=1502 RepID=UPI001C878466|nr:hypothetical protein [Clostridium perfringens]MCX0396960.1 hypothetical protein [Clostridium perfringens]